MPKVKPQRTHTEDDMRKALQRFAAVQQHLTLLPDDDDPVAILADTINEVLEARQLIEDNRSFATSWIARLSRR